MPKAETRSILSSFPRRPPSRSLLVRWGASLLPLFPLLGCSDDPASNEVGNQGGGTNTNRGGGPGTGGSPPVVVFGGAPPAAGTGGSTNVAGAPGPYELPPDFTETDLGGYKLGEPFEGEMPPIPMGGMGGQSDGCGTTILAVVRDFRGADEEDGHDDFEVFSGNDPTLGMVEPTLTDQKPEYTGICDEPGETDACPFDQQSTTEANFNQWYRFAEGVNRPYLLELSLEPNDGSLTFESHEFFPLDGAGWQSDDDDEHNYHFTTEVHTEFAYMGGEEFTFIGDDDVWVFINNQLALDLGGLHSEESGTVTLDAVADDLGLTTGNNYSLDLFHAERHREHSNFRIETNLRFTNCGVVVPEPPPPE